ncbi:acyltransferase [Xanthobacter sp. V0B-10]|uniref:acyltransferase family protein n=1 Tax=Xanthobacter albus TaxID=3119929 RepID=UPI0037266799
MEQLRSATDLPWGRSARTVDDILLPANNNFDLIRLIAACAVIFGHAYALSPQPTGTDFVQRLVHFDYSGSLAVKVFFFISGLLVTHALFRDASPASFVAKRVFRIFPALIVCNIITVFVIGLAFTSKGWIEYLSSAEIYRYLINNSILRDIQWRLPGVFEASRYGVNGSLWTLPWEWLCYTYVFIGLALGAFTNRWLALAVTAAVFGVYFFAPGLIGGFNGADESYWLLPCFLIGIFFALLSHRLTVRIEAAAGLWLLYWLTTQPVLAQLSFYIALFYSVLVIASADFVVTRLKLPLDASYGVYLYGFPIQQSLFHVFPASKIWQNQLSAMAIAIALGSLSSLLVERPAVRWGRNVMRDRLVYAREAWRALHTVAARLRERLMKHRSSILEFGACAGLSALVFALVLKFVYPGYFDPFWPHHSDFYLATNLRADPVEGLKYLSWARPVGVYTLAMIGNAPMRIGIGIIAAITILNGALAVFAFRRALGIQNVPAVLAASTLYFFTLYSAPGFYIFYSQDVWAQTSFFFLMLGGLSFAGLKDKSLFMATYVLFLLALLAFLSKETYALSALGVAAAYVPLSRWRTWTWRLLPAATLIAALGFALGLGIRGRSVFFGQAGGNAYQVDISPPSVLREWWSYASLGSSAALTASLVLLLAATWRLHRREGWRGPATLGLMAAAAGAAAWLPNSVLPNHFFAGYSWSGAYLLFLPILLLALIVRRQVLALGVATAAAVLLLLNPKLNRDAYAGGSWVLIQESTQRNLWRALRKEIRELPTDKTSRVLVTGISFPFSPFAHPRSLDELKKGRTINFSVVEYPPFQGKLSEGVTFLTPENYDPAAYDYVWVFHPDGTLYKAYTREQIAALNAPGGVSVQDLLNLPKLLEAADASSGAPPVDACSALQASVDANARSYGRKFLEACTQLRPESPYTWFYRGLVLEDAGEREAALDAYRKAVEKDTSAQPNPFFEQRLKALQAQVAKSS